MQSAVHARVYVYVYAVLRRYERDNMLENTAENLTEKRSRCFVPFS